MWTIIKANYWSITGICTSFLHVLTIIIALLVYCGGHQIWYGVPAFGGPVASAKK